MDIRKLSKLLYQLKLANQEMTTKFEKKTGFNITRYELLMFLKENGPCTQIALQKELKIDSAAVTRHLKILEEKKYVVRKRNQENNREIFVTISDQALEELKSCAKKHKEDIVLPLNEKEEEILLDLLTKLTKGKKE